MTSFSNKIKSSIQNWRRRKQNQAIEDSSDQLFVESLEQRVMLDGDVAPEDEYQAPEYQAWFMQLPGNVGSAVVDYFNSEAAAGSSDIWRPIAQPEDQDEQDPTGSTPEDTGPDLSRWFGIKSRTSYESSYWATYTIADDLWTGLQITVDVESQQLDDGSYLIFHRSQELDRDVVLPSGGGAPGPGMPGPGGGAATPYEEIDSDITTTVVHTTDAAVVSQVESTGTLNLANFTSYLTIDTDHTFRYEITGDTTYSVTADFETDLDLRWVALSDYTVDDEPEEDDGQTTNDSEDQLPLGQTAINIQYDVTGNADFDGHQELHGTRQIDFAGYGTSSYTRSGYVNGTFSVSSYNESDLLYTRGVVQYNPADYANNAYNDGQFGVRSHIQFDDDYSLSGTSGFTYSGTGSYQHDISGATGHTGSISFTISGTSILDDQSETSVISQSFLDVSEQTETNTQSEIDAAEGEIQDDNVDSSDDTSAYVPTTTYVYDRVQFYSKPSISGTSQFSDQITMQFTDDVQGLTTQVSQSSETYDTTGDYYNLITQSDIFSSDATSATFLSETFSLESSEEFVGSGSNQTDLTFTPTADDKFILSGYIDDQSSFTSGLVSNTIGVAMTLATVSAALRSAEEESGSGTPGADESGGWMDGDGSSQAAPLDSSSIHYMMTHRADGYGDVFTDLPTLNQDKTITYAFTKSESSDHSSTTYTPGHSNSRFDFLADDKMKVTTSDKEDYTITSQFGTSSLVTDALVTDGDYTLEKGMISQDRFESDDEWHIDLEVVQSESDMVSILEATEVDVPTGDSGTSGGTGTGGGTDPAGNPVSDGSSTDDDETVYQTDITATGTSYFENTVTGNYSKTDTETQSRTIIDEKEDLGDGAFNHLEMDNSYGGTYQTISDGDSWYRNDQHYFGNTLDLTPIEGRSQAVWDRTQQTSTTTSTQSSTSNENNSLRYQESSGDVGDLGGGSIPGAGALPGPEAESKDTQSSNSARYTTSSTSSLAVDQDIQSITTRILNTDSGSGTPGDPGSGAGGSGGNTPNGNAGTPAPLTGPTYTYTVTSPNGSKIETTLGGHSNVTFTSNATGLTDQIQSKLSVADGVGSNTNTLEFLTGVSPTGDLIVGEDAPRVDSTVTGTIVQKTFYDSEGRHDVLDGTRTYTTTTKNKRTVSPDSEIDQTLPIDGGTRERTVEYLEDNAETSESTTKFINTYDDYGTITTITEAEAQAAGDSSEEQTVDDQTAGDQTIEFNLEQFLAEQLGIGINAKGTGEHTQSVQTYGTSTTHIKTKDTVTDTQDDGSGSATSIDIADHQITAEYDQTDQLKKTFDSDGNLTVSLSKTADAAKNKITKNESLVQDFDSIYTYYAGGGGTVVSTQEGDTTSGSDETSTYSATGSINYHISKDADLTSIDGSITETVTGNGIATADDTQKAKKTKTYSGTHNLNELDPAIDPSALSGWNGSGGTQTGDVSYQVEKTKELQAEDQYSGTMTAVNSASINAEGEVENSITESYTNNVNGWRKDRETGSHSIDAFGEATVVTESSDTGWVDQTPYNETIQSDTIEDDDSLGYSAENETAYDYRGTNIKVSFDDSFATVTDEFESPDFEAPSDSAVDTGSSESPGDGSTGDSSTSDGTANIQEGGDTGGSSGTGSQDSTQADPYKYTGNLLVLEGGLPPKPAVLAQKLRELRKRGVKRSEIQMRDPYLPFSGGPRRFKSIEKAVGQLTARGQKELILFAQNHPDVYEAAIETWSEEDWQLLHNAVNWGYKIELKNAFIFTTSGMSANTLQVDTNSNWIYYQTAEQTAGSLLNGLKYYSSDSSKWIYEVKKSETLSVGDGLNWQGIPIKEAARNASLTVSSFFQKMRDDAVEEAVLHAAGYMGTRAVSVAIFRLVEKGRNVQKIAAVVKKAAPKNAASGTSTVTGASKTGVVVKLSTPSARKAIGRLAKSLGIPSRKARAAIAEVRRILGSKKFAEARKAIAEGRNADFVIEGKLITIRPNSPFSGLTDFRKRGFTLGGEAFSSNEELTKTLLHEIIRLKTSAANFGGVGSRTVSGETRIAFEFAEKAFELFFR